MTGRKKHILIVDDDTIFRITAKTTLSEDYEIHCAASAEDAYAQLNQKKPDLILLDVYMPGEDGLNFLHNIKYTPAWSCIPVLIVTGDKSPEIESIALENGAEGIIIKPYSKKNLLKYVRNLLELAELRSAMADVEGAIQKKVDKWIVMDAVTAFLLEKTKNGGTVHVKSKEIASELGISSYQISWYLRELANRSDCLMLSRCVMANSSLWAVSRKDAPSPDTKKE